MKVQELETYKEQYRKSQDEVKALKSKVRTCILILLLIVHSVTCVTIYSTLIMVKIQVPATNHVFQGIQELTSCQFFIDGSPNYRHLTMYIGVQL